ncbi:MAG: DNA primase [Bacteroidales bacterium]|nr:DNA primase [Bacteroidales bacterium]
MIKPETIQQIFETARIEEVIGDFVTLKKRGSNYLGLCPFHNEKTPSFSVSPSKGIYKCFGCGKAGNAVNFVIEHEHYSYPEALKYVAKKYGIDIEEEELTPEMRQELDERESMFTLNSFVSKYLNNNLLKSEEGKAVALSYLKERDFREATIEKFELGYAIDQWHDYSEHAQKNGYKKEILVKTGLSIDKGKGLIDRFRGRVIFPIHNLTGKVIGFGGRILGSEKSTAKYLNSPESEIYNKSKVLYGIYFAKNAIVKADNCYLVEGYTDVISMHQAGIENVVASSGTSLTVDQIRLIKRYTPNITILFDGDPAGIKASFRGIDLILEQGMNVKIVLFPEGEDPDSYVRSHRSSETETFIKDKAADFITFKTRLLLGETAGDPTAKALLIKEIVHSISVIPDGITRSVYIKECSAVMEVPEQTLVNELNKIFRNRFRKKTDTPRELIEDTVVAPPREEQIEFDPLQMKTHEGDLLRILLLYGDKTILMEVVEEELEQFAEKEVEVKVADYLLDDFLHEQISFEDETYNKILSEYIEIWKQGNLPTQNHFTNHPDPQIVNTVIHLLSSAYQLSENWEKNKIYVKTEDDQLKLVVMAAWMSFKSRLINKQLKEITEEIQKTDKDEADIYLLQQQFFELKKIANQIDRELKRTFTY